MCCCTDCATNVYIPRDHLKLSCLCQRTIKNGQQRLQQYSHDRYSMHVASRSWGLRRSCCVSSLVCAVLCSGVGASASGWLLRAGAWSRVWGAGGPLSSDTPGGICPACNLLGPCHVAGGSWRDCLSPVTDRTEGRRSRLVRVCRQHAGLGRPHAESAIQQAASMSKRPALCEPVAQLSCP